MIAAIILVVFVLFLLFIVPLVLSALICAVAEQAFHTHLSFWMVFGIIFLLGVFFRSGSKG